MKPFAVDICVIEDDASQRRYLVSRLQNQYAVVEAADGQTGLERIREYRPRVVVCDLLMPGISGLDVCRQVRSDPNAAGAYFIFTTICQDRETKHLALNIGADDYLTKPYDFDEFCARIQNGVRISRLQERLHYAALTDGLTGLWNHAHFRHLLDVEYSRTRRYGGCVALLMIDMDHFKAVNDTYGHEVGNRVLIGAARTIKRLVRDTDIVARYGGEEFAIICPRTSVEDARALAERIRLAISREVQIPQHPDVRVTTSIGVVSSDSPAVCSVLDLINASDQALYDAKRQGRDRVEVASKVSAEAVEISDNGAVERLSRQVASLSMQAKDLCLQSIWALVQALEARDPFTVRHSRNTMYYAQQLAEHAEWPENARVTINTAAMLHDLGKIGIPDALLQKAGPLTPAEAAIVRRVPLITCKILEPLRIFENEVLIIRHLRERWDGAGYPNGLREKAIPLGARLLAVAEAFEALTSDRCHRPRRSVKMALETIQADAGGQFDPEFVERLTTLARDRAAEWEKVIDSSAAATEACDAMRTPDVTT
jgi:diguanylate cyclase (GGDEF)-like protein